MKKFLFFCLLSTGLLFANAQDLIPGNPGMYPELMQFKSNAPVFTKGKVILADAVGKLISSNNAVLNTTEKDNLGFEHYRYQQTLAGIPVENAVYVMHVTGGKVISQNGNWVKDFPAGLQAAPSLNKTNALNKAMAFIGAREYKWQLPAEEAFIKREQHDANATFFPKGALVYYSGENDVVPSALRLAYKFDIYANYPLSRQYVFVDAVNGNILGKIIIVCFFCTPVAISCILIFIGIYVVPVIIQICKVNCRTIICSG